MSAETSRENERQWLVPEAEAQPIWDLFARIFRSVPKHRSEPIGLDAPFFTHSHWAMVGLVNNLNSLAFPEEEPEDQSDDIFAPYEFYEKDELGPLLDIMAEEGAQTLYFTDASFQIPGPVQAAVASREGLQAANLALHEAEVGYGIPINFVFGDTERWGLYIGEDNVAVLGAEPDLIERYLPLVGGLEFLQQRFAQRIHGDADPSQSFYRPRAARVYRKWYAAMRWNWPFPEPPTVPERAEQAET